MTVAFVRVAVAFVRVAVAFVGVAVAFVGVAVAFVGVAVAVLHNAESCSSGRSVWRGFPEALLAECSRPVN